MKSYLLIFFSLILFLGCLDISENEPEVIIDPETYGYVYYLDRNRIQNS